jgi:NAD(P)-dependent dehydrogenase (short-subunit alcohol dehydrogenase family)
MESVASTNRDRESRAVAGVVRAFGNLDIVFANARIGGLSPVGETDLATFEDIVRTNLTVVFFAVQSAAPHLNEKASITLNGRERLQHHERLKQANLVWLNCRNPLFYWRSREGYANFIPSKT